MRFAAARSPSGLTSPCGDRDEHFNPPAIGPFIRHVGFMARGQHRNLCLDAVLELARHVGHLPCCTDLLAAGVTDVGSPALDLIMLGRTPSDPLTDGYRQIGDAVLRSGVPVLLVPWTTRPGPFFGTRGLIVWDGSLSAISALRQVFPLLAGTDEILLADVSLGEPRASLRQAMAILMDLPGRRRIDATRLELDCTPLVLEAARMTSADYLVIGGFGRWNSLPSLLYGGADDAFLRARIPILMGQ